MTTFVVTIDGCVGSGKSTTGKLVSNKLKFNYLDTGLTYRAFAYFINSKGIKKEDRRKICRIAKKINIEFIDDKICVSLLSSRPFSISLTPSQLCSEEIGNLSSFLSQYKCVRRRLVDIQRNIAKKSELPIICDGRDMGSVVFPDAKVKIYMDAKIDVRALRKLKELGLPESEFPRIKQEILLRDIQDITRKNSPLVVPDGAFIIDTTNLTIEEQVEKVINIIKNEIKV